MANSLAQKFRIQKGMTLLTLHAPVNFRSSLQALPENVVISSGAKQFDQVHWFVTNKEQMEKEMKEVIALVEDRIICWTYYPKGTSGMQTDLTRDKGWDALLKHDELQWISLISFDNTWSAFGFRLKNETDLKKLSIPKVREIFNYVDPVHKTIRLPEEFAVKLKENSEAASFFNALSFTNKKEYIEWILTAKQEETKQLRIHGTIERLLKGWKNPANTLTC